MMVNRLNNKISSLENLFKTDSERLSELARLDKQVSRCSEFINEQR